MLVSGTLVNGKLVSGIRDGILIFTYSRLLKDTQSLFRERSEFENSPAD